jgi:cell division septum initiation protein DivIVA
VNESRIQQIIASEKKASEIYEAATKEAEQLPKLAEQDAHAIIEKARQQAETEAQALLAQAPIDEASAQIMEKLQEQLIRTEKLAKMHHERAVDYTLARMIGMEQR